MELTGKQKRHLRALAQSLDPVLSVGKEGVTEPVLDALIECLNTRELIKVRLQDRQRNPRERDALAGDLARRSGTCLVQVLGRVVVLYRPAPEDSRIVERIRLPD